MSGCARDEDVVEPARRIDKRQPRIHRDVQLAIVLESGGSQPADAALRVAAGRVLGEERSALGMTDEQRAAGVLDRARAIQHQVVDRDACGWLARKKEAGHACALRVEGLDPLLKAGNVGDDDAPVARDVEAGRLNDAPFFAADLDDLLGARSCGVDGEDGLPSPVEHVVHAARRLLEVDRGLERADEVRRKAADRAKDLDLNGSRWRDNEKRHGKRERKDASSHGEEQLNTERDRLRIPIPQRARIPDPDPPSTLPVP